MKSHLRINILPDPTTIQEAASKLYVDKKHFDQSITKKYCACYFKNKILDKVCFINLNSFQ